MMMMSEPHEESAKTYLNSLIHLVGRDEHVYAVVG